MTFPDLLILRHGETEWNAEGRLQGELDSPLTATGRSQAERQNALLRDFGVAGWNWYVSPQGRAQATAQIAMAGLAKRITTDARLAEIAMGRWNGRLRSELMAEQPSLFETDDLVWYDHAPEGEGLTALARRAGDFLTEMRGPAVIVTHGITSRHLRCHALGMDPIRFGELEGGQGVVFHLSGGRQTRLD